MSNISETGQQLSSSQQMLLVLKEARAKLEAIEKSRTEPIAIIGMGCRFPGGANDPTTFWQLLRDGVDAITEVPPDRWDVDAYYDPDPEAPGKMYTRYGGFLQQVDQFDPQFFEISPREAVSMDPQQRLLLEVSWEALENAGQTSDRLRCSQTGVFMGICTDDYAQLSLNGDPTNIDAYSSLGNTRSIAVGRIAYTLGLQGPNIQLDTACSSSLVAVHLAIQSLRLGESNLALAGGVNLILSPIGTINRCKLKALSPDGRCKTFDASANGYGQGEGCGVVVLKRLSDAVADGDNILALIRGSAVNHDGKSAGLTVPNQLAQEKVISQALKNAKVEPAQVSYVEAHGTGTSLGDPIEVGALEAVFGDRPQNQPLAIGSMKSNCGHLEAAAGIGCLMKVILALQHKEIPPSLHFKQPNPHIPWDELPIVVPTERMSWTSEEKRRIAGVSSFGISGTNAHVVLEEAPVQTLLANEVERKVHLLTLHAKSENALQSLARRYEAFLATQPTASLADVCFTANTRRAHFNHRLAVIAESSVQLQEALSAFARGETATVISGQIQDSPSPKIAFLFTGQGSQYIGMGRQLYEQAPVFRRTLDRCDEILRPYLKESLLSVLYPEPGKTSPLDQTAYTQPALFALEYALVELWKSWGVHPDVVIGHSVGEYVAACVAGVFSLEDGLKLVARRAALMQNLPPGGEMVAAFASEAEIRGITDLDEQKVVFAAINGPQNTVISGEQQAVQAICAKLEAAGITTKKLQTSHAFHSPLMEPILAEFREVAATITYAAPQIEIISNITGQLTAEAMTPDYWCRHLRNPVLFAAGLQTLHQQGYEMFVEIGPKPTLLGMGRNCLSDVETRNFASLPSLRQGQEDWQQILQSLGELYIRGVSVDWLGFDQNYQRYCVQLPTYPFERQRYWIQDTEKEYQKARSLFPENTETPIINFLNQGNTEQLVQLLQKAENFSPEQMKLLPELLTVLVREHQQHLMSDFIKDSCYELVWRQQGRIKQPKTQLGSWLIFADNQGIGQQLGLLLRSLEEICTLVFPGKEYEQIAAQEFRINPANPSDFQRLLLEVVEIAKLPLRGVVYLWSLDAVEVDALTVANLEVASQTVCGSALFLTQSLVKVGFTQPPALWLGTLGAQRVGTESTLSGVAQSTLWGLGKVIANEHTELNCTLVDLDPSANDNAQSLFAELWSQKPVGENYLAFRNKQRYVSHLVRSSKFVQKPLRLLADATYLITGGLGGVGLLVAKWMVEQGAKHLVLLTRSSPTDAAKETLKALEQTGVQVVVVQADVSQTEQVARVLAQIKTSMPQLRGIIHSAGILEDRLVVNHQWELFAKVFAPKVSGAWNLHTLTQDLPLDFFVLFSSVASMFGTSGVANYAAANAFLDTLAHYRCLQGLPGLSINWGPWSRVGMAAAVGSRRESQWVASGVNPMEPQQAIAILEVLLQQNIAQVGVMQVDWLKFLQQFPLDAYPALISELAQKVQQPASLEQQKNQQLPHILDQLKTTTTENYRALLSAYLQEQIAKVLGLSTPQLDVNEPLNYLGLDSLMVVELRNRVRTELAVDIPMVKFMEGQNVATIATYVSGQLTSHSTSVADVTSIVTSSQDWIEGEL